MISGGTPSITTFTIADIELFDATVGDTTDTAWQVDTATIGVLNGVIVVDGDKYPQTEAGINSAISDASAGDTIFLPAATYTITTGITVTKQLRIFGSPRYILGAGGSVLSGSGITILKIEADGTILENFSIVDATGNASTIGIDINNGASAVSDWRIRNLTLNGTDRLGTGIRLEFALRGVIESSDIERWTKGISLNINGASRSNANWINGNRIAVNVTGISVETNGINDMFCFGNTIEGNDTGAEIRDGKPVFIGNHFENNGSGGTLTNISMLGGTLSSSSNQFSGVTSDRDIVVDAGNASVQYSSNDTLNFGITHNGTGQFLVLHPAFALSTTGTGKITTIDSDQITGTNMSSVIFNLTGFSRLNLGMLLRNDSGDLDIRSSAGNDILIKSATGTVRWTIDNTNGDIVGASGRSITTAKLVNPTANPLEGSLSNVPRWIFKQVDFGDMTASATADTFTLWTFPANTMIHDIVGTVVTAWAGTGPVSAAVASVGTNAGAANDLTLDDNFFATGTRYELHDATASGGKGALLFDATDKFAPHMFVAGGVVEIQMDLTGGNHSTATAGQARIYALVSQPLGNTTTEAN